MRVKEFCADGLFYVRELSYSKNMILFLFNIMLLKMSAMLNIL